MVFFEGMVQLGFCTLLTCEFLCGKLIPYEPVPLYYLFGDEMIFSDSNMIIFSILEWKRVEMVGLYLTRKNK